MRPFFLAVILIIYGSCSTGPLYNETLLHNEWAAIEIITDGQIDPRDASGMRFAFDAEKNFAYQAFDSAKQEGNYQVKGEKLQVKTKDGQSFFVLIKTLKADTLRLVMNDGKERQITLIPMKFEEEVIQDSNGVDSTKTLGQDSLGLD